MKRHKQMNSVIKVTALKETQAEQRMVAAQQQLAKQEAQLEQLNFFYTDYQSQLDSALKSHQSIEKIEEIKLFLEKIEAGLDQQKRIVTQAHAHLKYQKEQWVAVHQKRKSLEDLHVRYQKEALYEDEKKIQRFLDDLPKKSSDGEGYSS